jgi:excisionase family DNA binding protein
VTPYLTTEQAAQLLCVSTRTVRGLAAAKAIPHRRIGGTRRLLFLEAELVAFVDGADDLETIETVHGGRVVRVKAATS